ncbi:hypothetical protein SynRS9909_02706 [Synechococcus sp. RS9909]|nr:hypothetical protein SynRS9909_02706 [Synechococcus sp. RS9909]
MGGRGHAGARRLRHTPGVRPHQQGGTPGTGGCTDGREPGGVQQAHGRDADNMRWVP